MQKLSSPLSRYYGGKTKLIRYIVPILDNDNSVCFVSLFTGGGSIEVNKRPHKTEVYNDKNLAIMNFYEVCKDNKLNELLAEYLEKLLYHEEIYKRTKEHYKKNYNKTPKSDKDKIELAVSVFCQVSLSFAGNIGKGIGYAIRDASKVYRNKIKKINYELCERLKYVTCHTRDALELFDMYNKKDVIFYADPPYINTNQGHYSGYTDEDYINLLERLSICKGKFILSCYPCDITDRYIKKNNWFVISVKQKITASNSKDTSGKRKEKTELIITNFDTNNNYNMFH